VLIGWMPTDMLSFLTTVAAYTVFGTLLFSAVGHVRRPAVLQRALVEQEVIPERLQGPVVAAVIITESAIGVAGLVALARLPAGDRLGRVTLLAAGTLLLVYAGYGWFLERHRPGVPCGCTVWDYPVSEWLAVRALLLCVPAFLAAVVADHILPISLENTRHLAVTWLASVSFGVVIWNLPAALHDPTLGKPRPPVAD
jgi:Methylamine utilisation protein MauE